MKNMILGFELFQTADTLLCSRLQLREDLVVLPPPLTHSSPSTFISYVSKISSDYLRVLCNWYEDADGHRLCLAWRYYCKTAAFATPSPLCQIESYWCSTSEMAVSKTTYSIYNILVSCRRSFEMVGVPMGVQFPLGLWAPSSRHKGGQSSNHFFTSQKTYHLSQSYCINVGKTSRSVTWFECLVVVLESRGLVEWLE